MSSKQLIDSPKIEQKVLIGVYWLFWIICLTLSIYSCSKDQPRIFIWVLGLLWARNCLPFIDLEERHLKSN